MIFLALIRVVQEVYIGHVELQLGNLCEFCVYSGKEHVCVLRYLAPCIFWRRFVRHDLWFC